MTDNYINFCLTADSNYTNVIAVTMFSILKNLSPGLIPRFFLFTQGFKEADLSKLLELKHTRECEIINVPMENHIHYFDCVDVRKFKNKWISLACYFRLLMFKVLPDDVEKCFYIDGDIIVDCDLTDVWHMLKSKLAAVVIEPTAMQHRELFLRHCYELNEFSRFRNNPMLNPYFNAGFELLNIKLAKELNIFEELVNLLAKYPNLPYADQDMLNIILGQKNRDKLIILPPEYNVFCNVDYTDSYNRCCYDEKEIKNSFRKPKVYHFAGAMKPWSTNDVMNHSKIWWKYYKSSPFYDKNCFVMGKSKNKMKEMVKKIFSLRNEGAHKVLTVLGFKIKKKNKHKALKLEVDALKSKLDEVILTSNQYKFESFLKDSAGDPKHSYECFIDRLFRNKKVGCPVWTVKWFSHLQNLKYLFPDAHVKLMMENEEFLSDVYLFWGTRIFDAQLNVFENAYKYGRKGIVTEVGFLTCIKNMADKETPDEFIQFISFMFDDLAPYYDARQLNRMEQMLNDKNFVITDEQRQRARSCIDRIVDTHLTKYNHQPIYEPQIGVNGRKKVLVVDQSYGDMSISKGLANDDTFKNMLESAIAENPEADIIVKTHPDTVAGAGGYYTGLKAEGNIYPMTDPINPISLIKACDKVYVCTTQLGFEALMCGKEVHVFGMPFYAGWGVTKDRQVCERRTNKRTLEEVFYIAYILYTHYVNPDTKSPCEIEEAMDYLLTKRNEFTEYEKSKTN